MLAALYACNALNSCQRIVLLLEIDLKMIAAPITSVTYYFQEIEQFIDLSQIVLIVLHDVLPIYAVR